MFLSLAGPLINAKMSLSLVLEICPVPNIHEDIWFIVNINPALLQDANASLSTKPHVLLLGYWGKKKGYYCQYRYNTTIGSIKHDSSFMY